MDLRAQQYNFFLCICAHHHKKHSTGQYLNLKRKRSYPVLPMSLVTSIIASCSVVRTEHTGFHCFWSFHSHLSQKRLIPSACMCRISQVQITGCKFQKQIMQCSLNKQWQQMIWSEHYCYIVCGVGRCPYQHFLLVRNRFSSVHFCYLKTGAEAERFSEASKMRCHCSLK